MRKVIRLNDPTTHGRKVITASPNSKGLIDGVPVAFEGHATTCGAELISTVGTSGHD